MYRSPENLDALPKISGKMSIPCALILEKEIQCVLNISTDSLAIPVTIGRDEAVALSGNHGTRVSSDVTLRSAKAPDSSDCLMFQTPQRRTDQESFDDSLLVQP